MTSVQGKKQVTCRVHNGTFVIPVQRGRPPVKCSALNPCTNADIPAEPLPQTKVSRPESQRNETKESRTSRIKRELQEVAEEARARQDESAPAARTGPNRSLAPAKEAKTLLEPQGWTAHGKAWFDEDGTGVAQVTAARGEELLVLTWHDGVLFAQNYSLWNTDKPSMNGKPASKLGFNPDELSDRELVRNLSGMRVTWWNRIGRSEETAVIPNKLIIEHIFEGGDETPGARVVKFVDKDGRGFKAFRIDALMKIG